jgi:murein DD-endopeptidase MepM/ murein hydrolase activator NlpD
VRRLALLLALAALLIAAFAAPSAGAAGGLEATQADPADSGGANYSTVSAEQKKKAARKRRAAAKRRAAKRRAAARRRAAKRRAARRKRRSAAEAPAPAPAPAPSSDHVFPVQGPFSFGGEDSRFGAGRRGHIHQGQDLTAAEGTPLVAPWDSTVEVVKFQAGGAGYYVVLDGDGEDRDYVFMHLRKGSRLVKVGDSVRKGQKFAEVGNTGSSSGAHLHFEIWVGGGWYTGGEPIDPLPILRSWL